MNAWRWVFTPLLLGLILPAVDPGFCAGYTPADISPPKPLREYRAAWIATVSEYRWPSKKDLTPEQQPAELLANP